MKCPKLVAGQLSQQIPVVNSESDCLKEECAWWQGDDEVCWVVQTGIALSSIASDLITIRKDIGRLADRPA